MLEWTVPCLCQGSTRAAWPFSRDVESGGAVPQGAGELQAEEPPLECSLGSCCEAVMGNARDRDNRGHQLVSDLGFVFSPAYVYSS